jgi:putative ABC transport system permease protein
VRWTLAWATLARHRARTLLAVLGVAVSAALLLDMVMLATGMGESFRELLLTSGFQLRVTPKGTLPFDTEATIDRASEIVAALEADPRVERVSAIAGSPLHVLATRTRRGANGAPLLTAFALGTDPRVQGDYALLRGEDIVASDRLVASESFMREAGVRVGDTLDVAAAFDPQLRTYGGRRRVVVSGVARFYYGSAGATLVALPLRQLQAMRGDDGEDRVSAFMARVRDGADPEAVRGDVERRIPRVSVVTTTAAMEQVERRLSYFRQLALILGAISLVIGFLLVATLVTVSVNERVGEIAVLRAIGVSRRHVVEQIVAEGLVLSVAGALLGLALGIVTARYLNRILADFPGLPAAFEFFVFRAGAAWRSLGLLVLSGVVAGVYPAWRAGSLPISTTLREEAVG